MKRSLTTISICLNLVLLATFIFLKNSRSDSQYHKQSVASSQKVVRQINVVVSTNHLAATDAAKFNWRTVESGDYPTYIANLRSIHCPEKTIFNILFADIEKL